MAHAIGCLGSAVDVCRRERAERAIRKVQVQVPKRNQGRERRFAVISYAGTNLVRVVGTRAGHLHHVQRAYLWAEKVEYLTKK